MKFDPTPATYLKVSLAASLGTIALLYAVFFIDWRTRRPSRFPSYSLPCGATSGAPGANWMEIAAGPQSWLQAPPTLHANPTSREDSRGTTTTLTSGDRSLSMMIQRTSLYSLRSDSLDGAPRTGGYGTPACRFMQVDGHLGTVQTNYHTSNDGGDYYEVFAEVIDRADTVVRVTVAGNSQEAQRTGLTIVRSLRFREPR